MEIVNESFYTKYYDFLPEEERHSVWNSLINGSWQFRQVIPQKHPNTWLWFKNIWQDEYFTKTFWEYVNKATNYEYDLIYCHCQGQTFGQNNNWHQDCYDGVTHSFIYYPNLEWNSDWGGRLLIADTKDTRNEISIPPIPNSAVFFPAEYWHIADAVTSKTTALRVSVSYKMRKKTV
jgi:hypothetical protein